ncbi:serine protease [Streptomyces sp. RK75]|uniref:serine protease n=1 Tax=Streptomyces sp. RK75 TaxID=2824895 RepID=UPI0016218AE2|nr:serine protease [Streptomyces sp. RK75]MBQ0868379.1 serine protease [Streptomyces sp. RK75]
MVTSHEAVDGLSRAVLHAQGTTFVAESRDITPLPEWDLALIHTPGLPRMEPLVIGGERPHPETPAVVLTEDGPLPTTLTGTVPAVYTSTARYHSVERALRLELPAAAAVPLRLSRWASGAPVADSATGAVLGVLGTALHATSGQPGPFAVPLHTADASAPDGPLGVLLRRNGASAPGFGPDLNLAGALRLAAASVDPAPERCAHAVTRPEVAEHFDLFAHSGAAVLALVGAPGTGRTTELAAVAARRARAAAAAPSVWLRGAELRPDDTSLREAVGRALAAASGSVTASRQPGGSGTATAQLPAPADPAPTGRPADGSHDVDPDAVARLASAAGRPLLILLDAPEEMPLRLAHPHTLRQWTVRTADWLRASGARLAVACRPEFWEQAATLFPEDMLYALAGTEGSVRVGQLSPRQAVRVRAAYGLPDGVLAPRDVGHPLAIRMLAQVRAAQGALCGRTLPGPSDPPVTPGCSDAPDPAAEVAEAVDAAQVVEPAPARHEIFSAFLDLLCLRSAQRLAWRGEEEGDAGLSQQSAGTAVGGGAGGPASVRRLAARAAGRLHEAARRCLASGQGELSRAAFDELFPWHDGWASAVLAEGALAPAGEGYRFVDEEFSDWLQGCHLDLDVALDALVQHRGPDATGTAPVPRHRIGPVVQALLLCDRRDGAEVLAPRLRRLADALDGALDGELDGVAEPGPGDTAVAASPDGSDDDTLDGADDSEPNGEIVWWAAHLLAETLPQLPEVGSYVRVLVGLAKRVAERQDSTLLRDRFGPGFWGGLRLEATEKVELLRHLLPADPPADQPCERGRCLDLLEELLTAEPRTVQPLLCEWFSDLRPLRRRTDMDNRTVPTVATAAQALLYTHRRRAVDELTDALVDAAHPRADELLAELVRDELPAMCRAVERWAYETHAGRRTAAAGYGVLAARRARTDTDRKLLRSAARALLRRPVHRPAERTLHTAALAVLVRDPHSRSQHMAAALRRFTESGDAELAGALGTALATHPEPVLAAFHALLTGPADPAAQSEAVRALARVDTPALARRAALLVREHAELRPWRARDDVARFVGRRLRHGPGARAVLRPLVAELLCEEEPVFRARLAGVLGAGEGPLRDELLDLLLAQEKDDSVLEAALDAVARRAIVVRPRRTTAPDGDSDSASSASGHGPGGAPDCGSEARFVRRIGALMADTAQGAASFDRALAGLARELPGFTRALRVWVAREPQEWTPVLGPRARRLCDSLDAQPPDEDLLDVPVLNEDARRP